MPSESNKSDYIYIDCTITTNNHCYHNPMASNYYCNSVDCFLRTFNEH